MLHVAQRNASFSWSLLDKSLHGGTVRVCHVSMGGESSLCRSTAINSTHCIGPSLFRMILARRLEKYTPQHVSYVDGIPQVVS